MVYHRSSSGGSSMADTAARRSARDEDDYYRTREEREDFKHANYSRGNSRYKDSKYLEGGPRSKNNKDEGKYGDNSRYSKDIRGRERDDRYHDRSRDMREDGPRYRDGRDDGSRYRDMREEGLKHRGREENSKYRDAYDEGRYREGKDSGCFLESSSQYDDEVRFSDRYGGSRYSEGSRYSSRGSRYSSERGEGHSWYSDYSQSRENSSRCSESRYEGSDSEQNENKKYSREDNHSMSDTTSPAADEASGSVAPEQEKLQNMFQNDGSFLEMFKKMQEANKQSSDTEAPQDTEGNTSKATTTTDKPDGASRAGGLLPRKGVPTGIVGKRRGGRVLPTGMVKKQKREEEVEETPKDAWSIYMAEVRKYKQATCEEEGKTRPLVK